MGIEVARSATKLGRIGELGKKEKLLFEPFYKHHQLLAQAGGRGRLPVGMCEHGDFLPLLCQLAQDTDLPLQYGQHLALQGFFEAERNGRIVDVLGGKPKVDKLLVGWQAQGFEALFEEVLYGFYIMVGSLLNTLDALGIGLRKLLVNGS